MRNIGLASLILSLFFYSCEKKDSQITRDLASLTIINSIATFDNEIKVKYNVDTPNYFQTGSIGYYSLDNIFGLPNNVVVPLSIVFANDTLTTIYDTTFVTNIGDIYSLFLTGTNNNQIQSLLKKETLPTITDSSCGVRFVNLSPDAGPISINIAGGTPGSEWDHLEYKSISSFKTFPANSTIANYLFEVRNATTHELLYNFNYDNIARFKNVTLVARGLSTSDGPPFEIVRVNNY